MRIDPNIQDADSFYLKFIQAHENLSEQDSFELNARLIFILANQVGDAAVLAECIAAALPKPVVVPESVAENGAELSAGLSAANESAADNSAAQAGP